ncbi:hypothetical protein BS78_04G298700 [Paspalum vaginatum]|nr:hypothetical protein BS78_04G298700 [Paspalum vaginatum]
MPTSCSVCSYGQPPQRCPHLLRFMAGQPRCYTAVAARYHLCLSTTVCSVKCLNPMCTGYLLEAGLQCPTRQC